MTWKHRQSGSWQTPSVKTRENNAWRQIGGSDGGGGGGGGDSDSPYVTDRFYTDGPPTRSGATITYPSDGHSSLQAAADSLTSNDTLVIEAGSYSERILLTSSHPDHITIRGEGNRDTTLVYPGTSEEYIIRVTSGGLGVGHSTDATLSGSHSGGGHQFGGDDRVTVSDTSPFSVGDDIHVWENRHPYGHPERPASDETREYNTITDIDGSDLVLDHPLFLNYPNNNSTAVGVMDWELTDLRISNLDLEGDGNYSSSSTNSRLLRPYGTKDCWIDDITCRDSSGRQQGISSRTYRLRADNMDFRRVARYGWTVTNSSTRSMFTNMNHYGGGGSARYAVRFGGSGSGCGSVDGYVNGAYGTLGQTPVVNCHYGGWWAHFEDITAEDSTDTVRMRSHHLSAKNLTDINTTGKTVILQNQWPTDIHVDGGRSEGYSIDKDDSWVFFIQAGEPRGDLATYATNVTFENFDIQPYTNSSSSTSGPGKIGYLSNDGADIRGDFILRDIYYNGQKLTQSDVENFENYDIASIENLIVE